MSFVVDVASSVWALVEEDLGAEAVVDMTVVDGVTGEVPFVGSEGEFLLVRGFI